MNDVERRSSAFRQIDRECRAQLFGIDLENEVVRYTVRSGPGREFTDVLTFLDLMEGLSGWTVRSGSPAVSPRGVTDPRESQRITMQRRAGQAGAVIVVPLRYGDRIMGTLTAVNRIDQRNFSEDDVELLSAIAGLAAAAIANAELLEEMHQARLEAESANLAKSRFLANMSYEFRTPLTSIGGFAELLQSGMAGDLTPQAQEYVAAIIASVERLSQQIESVLDLTQSEAGLLPLAMEEIDLMPFLTKLAREREERIVEAGINLNLRGNQLAGKVQADRKRLGRAIGHIFDNAIAATGKGGRILVDVARGKKGVKIVVSDNGAGMSANQLAHALEGYRIAADGKGVERRQGLGLPLAKQLIEAHGGRLDLQSQKGVGTTVTIALP